MRLDLAFRPPGPVAAAFMASDAFVRGIRGPIGSGKSTACAMEIVRRTAERAPGPDGRRRARWAIVRNTYPELRTTTMKTWFHWFPAALGEFHSEGPPRHHIRTADFDLEVLFLALDRPEDVRKLLSLELTGAWINEARELPKGVLDGLTGRVGRYPSARDGGAGWCGIVMDTNPPDTDHWWYRLAEEERPRGFAFFAQGPGDGPGAENLANLPPGYYDRAALGKDEAWTRVYVRGEYGFVADGRPVYPEWRDGLHVGEAAPLSGIGLVVGLDFGLTPAAVIGQRAPSGQWRWLAELVAEDMGARRFAELLGGLLRGRFGAHAVEIWGDPAGVARAQTDERTVFDILRAAGLPARPAPANDFTLRREAVAAALTRLVDGRPGLVVDPACRVLRKGMAGAYRFRRLGGADGLARDVPEKNRFSHVCEAAQYLMLGGGEGRLLLRRPDGRARPAAADGAWSALDGIPASPTLPDFR